MDYVCGLYYFVSCVYVLSGGCAGSLVCTTYTVGILWSYLGQILSFGASMYATSLSHELVCTCCSCIRTHACAKSGNNRDVDTHYV